jgi:hypothetical protein
MRRWRWRRLALAPMALLLAACGSSGGVTGSPAAVTAPSPAATPPLSTVGPSSAASPALASSTPKAMPSPSAGASASPAAVAAGGAVPDACSMFSLDQASALAGATLTDVVKNGSGSGSVCQYKGGHTYVIVTLKLLASAAAADAAFAAEEAQARAAGGSGSVSSVSGLGDSAYESRTSSKSLTMSGLVAVTGPMFVSLVTNTSADDTSLHHCVETIIDQL